MGNDSFSSRLEFEEQISRCLARASERLDLFDTDFSLWQLGTAAMDGELRRFLTGKGRIRMLAHDASYLKQHCPRFLRLLRDFSHAIECRIIHPSERHLTDSFCIGDEQHLVRRFHRDHPRGEAVFDDRANASICSERFNDTWRLSTAAIDVGVTGL
jgi:hypothetical protein